MYQNGHIVQHDILNFKNAILMAIIYTMYKATLKAACINIENKSYECEEKEILKNTPMLLSDFLTEFEVMGSLVSRGIMNKHMLFDLFRPILLAIKDDEDVQKFIKLRSENAGKPYFNEIELSVQRMQ